jgi:hypothetical protein
LQAIHLDLFPIRVLDRRVVSVHKHRLYELNRLFTNELSAWCHLHWVKKKKKKKRALERVAVGRQS